MVLLKTARDLNKFLHHARTVSKTIGFVPTMGALHAGHLSLIASSKAFNHVTVSSIFVNPTQFNDPTDFAKYPVTREKDILALEQSGCDFLFLPSVDEMYPQGTGKVKHYPLGYLESILEGKFRPGHFQGVCQVMERLIEIVQPDNIYMGQKDYQQCLVVKKLLAIMNASATLHACPTLREDDGLAMSSRNLRLTADERSRAPVIYKVLSHLKNNLRPGDLTSIKDEARLTLTENHFKTDYIEVADANTLELVNDWDGKQPVSAVVAAFINEIRLIDNIIISN